MTAEPGAAGTKPAGPVVTVTGKLHIEYADTGPTGVYLQPAKGPGPTVLSLTRRVPG
ncbi:hypothetical protein [Arthrobacter sp. LAR12-1-1.1]|uniref:hypothetical protein n=1 Tax=Arthrobacter sp. LAR12-1-1.1 TaxID=3135215 RepID=UPI00341DEC5A